MGDWQDGEGLVRPWRAAQIVAVAVRRKRWGLSFKFTNLTFPFGSGSGTEFADRVCEPLLQGAHGAPGAGGTGGRAA